MDSPRHEPRYDQALRMVMWGETREDVYHMLSVNGVTGERADAIYAAARRERVAAIHDECRARARFGLLLAAASLAVFAVFWFGLGWIPRILIGGLGAAALFGLWKFIDGFTGMMMAARKEGPVSTES